MPHALLLVVAKHVVRRRPLRALAVAAAVMFMIMFMILGAILRAPSRARTGGFVWTLTRCPFLGVRASCLIPEKAN